MVAPLAAEAALAMCCDDDGQGRNCSWYHGALQYFRMLDLVASPATHSAFFTENFGKLARGPDCRRVLVSGAADCAMAAQILSAFREADVEPELTIVDRCETPLFLNRWFAEREGARIVTHAANALDYDSAVPFDLISTHCFLGYFMPEERTRLAAKWFSLLRKGGRVVTINPVRKDSDGTLARFSSAQAASFQERALAVLQSKDGAFEIDPERFQNLVRGFTESFWSYPVRSVDEIAALFEGAGFAVEQISPVSLHRPITGVCAGPTEPGLAFVSVVAVRD